MFYAVTGSVLGTYEGIAVLTKRTASVPTVPTVSNLASRHPAARAVVILWALGLCWHIAKHERLVDSQHG